MAETKINLDLQEGIESQDKHSTIQKKWELLWMKIHGYYNKHCGVEANENPYRVFCAYSETDKKLADKSLALKYYQDRN